jgi:error-prone DNA polymerase
MAILREHLTVPTDRRSASADPVVLATSAQLSRLPSGGEVAVAGLVIARQRPGTANGTMFLLFEDEFGTINLIVSKAVYERHRRLARAEPLLLARGRLERTQEQASVHEISRGSSPAAQAEREQIRPVINVIVRELAPLERFISDDVQEQDSGRAAASVHRLPGGRSGTTSEEEEAMQGAEVGSSMRAAAPPVQSFAMGRRR